MSNLSAALTLFAWPVAWTCGGLLLVRRGLCLRGGVEVAALALPVGLLAHILFVNALARLLPVRFVLAAVPLGLALAWAFARRGCAPLEWELSSRARRALLALALLAGVATYALGAREVFPDDGCHASLGGLVAGGEFPLRFPCNPELRLAYHYGVDLLVAAFLIAPGASPWLAIDLVRALVVVAVLALAFLAGWRARRTVLCGLLAAGLLATIGQATWLAGPLAQGGPSAWLSARAAPLADTLARVSATPYGLYSPGSAPAFVHAHRSLAWTFGPFVALLLLALMDARLERRRRALALALAAGAASVVQSGALPLAFGALGAWALLAHVRPFAAERDEARTRWLTLVLALALAAVQGGPLTDGLLARLDGVVDPMSRLTFAPLQLPSCRGQAPGVSCLVLSVLALGLGPWLWPVAAARAWREASAARLALLVGCALSGLLPLAFRYERQDTDLVRLSTYALWTLGALSAPSLDAALRSPGLRRWAGFAALPLLGLSGAVFLLMHAGLSPASAVYRAHLTGPRLFGLGPLDDELRPLSPRLPASALMFDPRGCMAWVAARPAAVFGRYSFSVDNLARYEPAPPEVARLRVAPTAEGLRAAGFTHAYVDAAWWRRLRPEARAAFLGGPFELLGWAGAGRDFRALLRVCASREGCRFDAPAALAAPP